jgi:hypothetical protein
MIELLPDSEATAAIAQLRDLVSQLERIRGSGGSGQDMLNDWREWSARALYRGATLFSSASMRGALLGDRFELLHTISVRDQAPTLAHLLNAELQLRLETLNAAIAEIESFRRSLGTLAVVLDTSIMMNAGPRVARIAWDDVVGGLTSHASFIVPIRVVEELDNLKDRGSSQQKREAQFALKWLDETVQGSTSPAPFPPAVEATETEVARDAGTARIRVWVDDLNRTALVDGDRDIIDRALQLKPYTTRTVLVTMDYTMAFRAKTLRLAAVRLEHSAIPKPTSAPAS